MKRYRFLRLLLAMIMVLSMLQVNAYAYSKEQATLTFTETGIDETVSGNGYSISGTTLVITAGGTYRITGACNAGHIEVSKGLSNVTLILKNLKLGNSETAPIVVKKNSSALVKLDGENILTNDENAENETTDPDNFEGAAIKVKTGSSLTVFGDGSLEAVGNAKNAIKGGAESSLIVDGGSIKATAVNNGIAFDSKIVINTGSIEINAGGDGLKAEPDEGDATSEGTITINGGEFNIKASGDGIQAAECLTINNGVFDIKTLDGYGSKTFDKNTMSCKGLKATGNNDNESAPTNEIIINGGSFKLDTADDAIHSKGYCDITGGTFDIYTGDDGVHADSTLNLGKENGYERDPEINIYSSYEGLEGNTINSYSGKYYVVASDDGVNCAGGSSNGSGDNHDSFTPGGPRPGQNGGPSGDQNTGQGGSTESSVLNINGGEYYIDCQGDGLDSNGAMNLLGGDITVLSMRGGGDNSPIDADGNIVLKGATIFAAGSKGMGVNLSGTSQSAYTSSSSYSADSIINITCSGKTFRSEKLVRNINYLLYSQPDMGSCQVSVGTSRDNCSSNAFAHNWDEGTIQKAASVETEGSIKYQCADCGKTELKTLAKLASVNSYSEDGNNSGENNPGGDDPEGNDSDENNPSGDDSENDETNYTAQFVKDEHVKINVFYTQDYGKISEENVSSAAARNSSTGLPDNTGDGQINFQVVTALGYKLEEVKVEGEYKNLKELSDAEQIENLYRVTKVKGNLTITIKTVEVVDEFKIQDAARLDAINNKRGTKKDPYFIDVRQAENDTLYVTESYVKGKVNERIIKVSDLDGEITVNAGTKYQLKGKAGTYEVLGENTAGKVSKKGKVNIKAIKNKPRYSFSVTFKNEEDKDVTVKFNVINLQLSDKKLIVSSLKNSDTDAITKNTVKLVDISNADAEIATGIWSIKDKKGISECEIAAHNLAVTVTPKENEKGTVKLICEINGKKYTASVKVVNK